MNDPNLDELWRDLLDEGADSAFPEWSRTQTLACARRRRWRRKLRRAGFTVAGGCALLCALVYLGGSSTGRRRAPVATESDSPPGRSASAGDSSPPPVRYLTDEELLSRFPHRPVALIGSPEGERLVFLDDPTIAAPSDEEN